ncbi:transcription regulator protein BACH1 [Oryzias latipes]|uniref:BTB and CNC homology 1, basic leucine zipper transcription factor 1 b n=1 Tax=Oryzias latipes TaxID=8090 RepID=H2LI07_ORYLA|nr:transcription regulator protein BACH1 [Oryzias latipes]
MSQMAMSTSRSSVFTFESTVHSSHVLHRLDEQRCRDTLCDVTVMVEGQSFRAHRSVLTSCSEYFSLRISSLMQHGAVVTLPPEVTVEGFEALLKFAYTSKLHFVKENVLQIRNAASILGFRDLDEACFDFLLPKFFSKSKSSSPHVKKMCCEKNHKKQVSKEEFGTDSDNPSFCDKEVKPVADSSSQQEVSLDCNKPENNMMESPKMKDIPALGVEAGTDSLIQCPKYRKFQLACGKEACAPEKKICNDCILPCSPSPSSENSNKEHVLQFPGNSTSNRESKGQSGEPLRTQTHDRRENHMDKVEVDSEKCRSKKKDELCVVVKDMEEVMEHTSSPDTCRANSLKTDKMLSHCSLGTFNDPQITCSREHQMFVAGITDHQPNSAACASEPGSVLHNIHLVDKQRGESGCCQVGERESVHADNLGERSTMEMEVTGPLDMQQGSDTFPFDPNFPPGRLSTETSDRWAQSSSSEGPKGRSNPSCLFYGDLEKVEYSYSQAGMSECEGTSQSCGSPVNSGEDGFSETETEGDSESSTRERARQVQLPFPVDRIINLSRNDFQQLLKQYDFTKEQLDFVHDMRRRSKNRLAAQRCRKRKLDCIYNLQCEINKLKTEREKLIVERSQLGQMKLRTCHSVSALCQRVCSEANLQPEQLQVLAKYISSECPLSSLFPHIDAFLTQHGFPLLLQAPLPACTGDFENKDTSSSGRDRTTDEQPL